MKKIDKRPEDKRPKGAIYRFEKWEEHQANIKRLEQAKKKCKKKLVKLCDSFNTWVSGGNKQTREQLKEKLEPTNFITST
jgi:hypothetical protein